METKFLLPLVAVLVLLAQCDAQDPPPFECYKCDSSEANCITNVSAVAKESCTSFCITKNASGKITRGCSADPCEGDTCKKCNTALCNAHKICTKCDTTSDPSCLEISSTETKFNQICDAADTKCIINIKEDKTLERRCASSDEKCASAETCDICEVGNCNNKVFPSNRRRCYQCSATDCDVVQNNDKVAPKLCLLDPKDDCYITGTEAKNMTRGCKSDKDSKCTDDSCYKCNKDNCNNLEYEVQQSLRCRKCTGNKSDTACLWSSSDYKDCDKKINYNQEGMCYTKIKNDTVQRGCLYDEFKTDSECKKDDGCTTCKDPHGCNNQAVGFTCLQCRSDLDTKCWKPEKDAAGQTCRNEVANEAAAKCFHGIWNKVLIRGCLVDADPRMQVICNDMKNTQCTLCDKADCNNEPSGAASIAVTTGLIALLVLAISSM